MPLILLMDWVPSLSRCIPNFFLELSGDFLVYRLIKNLLSIFCMVDLNCVAKFDTKRFIIRY
jgi:hypothetical protein